MRYLKLILLAILGIALLTVALANRSDVTLRLVPDDLAVLLGWSWQREVPLFVVLFGGAVAGLLIGVVWEWLREHRQRAEAAAMRRTLERMERDLVRLRGRGTETKDDVLALVEDGRGR